MSDPPGEQLNLNLHLNLNPKPDWAVQAIRVSNAKINATHRCQLPVTLAQVPHSDYYPIYMQRRRLFSAASWIFFLNTSSFRFVPRHLAAILCQFPVHCV